MLVARTALIHSVRLFVCRFSIFIACVDCDHRRICWKAGHRPQAVCFVIFCVSFNSIWRIPGKCTPPRWPSVTLLDLTQPFAGAVHCRSMNCVVREFSWCTIFYPGTNSVKVWSLDCRRALAHSVQNCIWISHATDFSIWSSCCSVFSVLWVEKHSLFCRQFSITLLPFPFIRATDSAHFHWPRKSSVGGSSEKATNSRCSITFISFAHQWVHAHLVNFPSEQRTRVESGWTISTLRFLFYCLLLLYIDRVHITLSSTKRRDANEHRSNGDALIYPAIHTKYICLRSLKWKTIRSMILFLHFHIFRATRITCIVQLKGAISLASSIALTFNSMRYIFVRHKGMHIVHIHSVIALISDLAHSLATGSILTQV